MASSTNPTETELSPLLPTREIPGSTGIPFFSPLKDRFDYYYLKGKDEFFQSKIKLYSSTVFRTNVPPGPFMSSNPRVIALLDSLSFPTLFDTSKVHKKNVFTGTYTPSTSLTGNFRVCSYLDPSEPSHPKIKQFLFNLLSSRKPHFLPSFHSSYALPLFSSLDQTSNADFNKINNRIAFDFVVNAFFGAECPANMGLQGKIAIWLLVQLLPLASNLLTKFVPRLVEDLLLHTFALPAGIAVPGYRKVCEYFREVGGGVLDMGEKVGLGRDEAWHNLVFASCFNTYGGLRVMLPGMVRRLGEGGGELHGRLAKEIRGAVEKSGENGRITLGALEEMELVKSVVYEVLRIDPPVEFQYAHAKKDFVVQSHDAAFQVRKGEMLFGYQPIATRDPHVFGETADKFVPDRFVGPEGAQLLKYVWWSNGPETESPTVNDKQCAGKDFVVLVARLFVAELFLYYDSFTVDVSQSLIGPQINFTSLIKAKGNVN